MRNMTLVGSCTAEADRHERLAPGSPIAIAGLGLFFTRHHLKHAIDYADVEVHMLVQARSEAVDEGGCADVQGGLAHLGRTGAVGR